MNAISPRPSPRRGRISLFDRFQCGSAELTSAKLYIQQKQFQKAEESLLKEVRKE